MLYIVSQNGMRITDLHSATVITPEHDREEEEVYKIMINGAEFGRYQEYWKAREVIENITEKIWDGSRIYKLPKEEDIEEETQI